VLVVPAELDVEAESDLGFAVAAAEVSDVDPDVDPDVEFDAESDLEFAVDAPSIFGFTAGVEYRSAYQPPPLRMKFPAEISLCAVFSLHAGQVSSGSSTIRCSVSHSWAHRVHLYSYVGIWEGTFRSGVEV